MLQAADRRAVASGAGLLTGCALSALAYGSWVPAFLVVPFFLGGYLPFVTGPWAGQSERRAYSQVFSIGWLMAGVAAVYARLLGDPVQNLSDPSTLYDLSAGRVGNLGVEAISTLAEGAGAITVWRFFYRLAGRLGLPPEPYWGILVNTVLVALTGVVAVKCVRTLFPDPGVRLRHAVHLLTASGLAWMFAAIHLRDAFVLLAVSLLILLWIRYLSHPVSGRLAEIALGTLAGVAVLGFFRTEFAFLPLAMLAAGVAGLTIAPSAHGNRRGLTLVTAGIGGIVATVMYLQAGSRMFELLSLAADNYSRLSAANASEGSLGVALVTSQPLPIKIIVGSVYLLVFPIPFWSGFGTGSAYHVFKSFNVLYFYLLVPMVVLGLIRLTRSTERSAPLVFIGIVTLGFLMAIAGTSLENRHLGAFLLPLVLLAVIPDLRQETERRALGRLWGAWIFMIASIHLAWTALRVL